MNQPQPDAGVSGAGPLGKIVLRRTCFRTLLSGLVVSQLLLAVSGFALNPSRSIFQYNCQTWSRQNGLPAGKINCVTQSKDGYIWLGTQKGLVRFDGLGFKVIPIDLAQNSGQEVRSLTPAANGGIFFTINAGGFGSYAGRKFAAIGDERWARPDMNATTILQARDGALWMGEELGFGRWVNGRPGESLFDEATTGPVLSIYEDPSGRVWLGTAQHGLFYWADGKLVRFPDDQLKKHNIYAVAMDAENQIWLGTEDGLLCYTNGRAKTIPPIYTEVTALLVDRHGTLWVGTSGSGLARYQNDAFTCLRKTDGLVSDYVTSLFEDAEGSLWVGTRRGLNQLTDVEFPIVSSKDGICEGSVHSVVASSEGGLWLTTDTGLSYFNGQTATNFTQAALFPNPYVKLGFEGSNGDVYLVDGDKNIEVLSHGALARRYVNQAWPSAFAEDSNSVLVAVGTGQSLFRLQADGLHPYQYRDGLQPAFYWINNLCVARDGAIWVASKDGIFRIQNGRFRSWSVLDGLPNADVLCLCEDADGCMWAGSVGGLTRIKDGKLANIPLEKDHHEDAVDAIVPDLHGDFWISTGHGFLRVSRRNLDDFADGQTNQIQTVLYDGLESVKSTDRTDQENSGCRTLDGRIWFPSPWGVVMIDPTNIPANPLAPPVHIDRLLVNGREVSRSEPVVLPPGKDEIEFTFSVLSFIASQELPCRYQLKGYDTDWLETREPRAAIYNNLKPGVYTLHVIAANADGVWNRKGDSLTIKLLPHFYQTVWFYLVEAGLVLALLGGIYGWRVRHLRTRSRELQAARDRLEAEVNHRTSELAAAVASLQREMEQHKHTAVALKERTRALEGEIEERKQIQLEVERVHRQLLEISRQAGMAEVASNVLHNVGNVLNSVNVSAALVAEGARKSRVSYLDKVVRLLNEHATDLGAFMTGDPKGRQLPGYLSQLAAQLNREQQRAIEELELLRKNIEHIKDIVAMQQGYAKVSGIAETVEITGLVEDALRMNAGALARHEVALVREYAEVPPVTIEKHKVLQILVNLIRNAKYACEESGRPDKQVKVKVSRTATGVRITVEDNGIGIPPENLGRIFNHGFTTRRSGHGFGLHSGALAARELGGVLTVRSEGLGRGATFDLELPLQPPKTDV